MAALLFVAVCCFDKTAGEFEIGPIEHATVVYVVDGDTLQVQMASGEKRIRLIGVDAPESVHPDESRNTAAGAEASAYMESLVSPGDAVWLEKDVSETDEYGRLLRYVWTVEPGRSASAEEVAALTLNGRMVADGFAKPSEFPPDTKYAAVWESLA